MNDIAISVEGLGKLYRIGSFQGRYPTFRDSVSSALTMPVRAIRSLSQRNGHAKRSESIWALKDVSFEIKRGEVIGIIGRNGAGKSTLLKILSRITDPTEGSADLHGRVGSLIEVGTGFHPELTGRENTYLNGAILGMGRREIDHKFDEIVAFAEVEKFIDTPVKHYSSGMYLRLAFAVAAHLEPEILIVDEVLAVGDAEFQKKCLGKMSHVAKLGRTVLFVSHNMAAIKALCSEAILLKDGHVLFRGQPEEAINRNLVRDQFEVDQEFQLPRRDSKGPIRFTNVNVLDHLGQKSNVVQSGEKVSIELSYENMDDSKDTVKSVFQIFFTAITGERLFVCSTLFNLKTHTVFRANGRLTCLIAKLPLIPGQYTIDVVCNNGSVIEDNVENAKTINVMAGDFFGSGKLPPSSAGWVLVDHSWHDSS